ncbi:MAG: ThuA domain-containing protein [Opitutus sp.]|nr:ThuA domain-containing protein [Opitutus sp.]
MKTSVALVFTVLCHAIMSVAGAAPATKKVLFFTKSSGFEHSVIKRVAGQPSFAMQVLQELGEKNNLEFIESKDGSLFSTEYLAQFDAILFFTSGVLTLARHSATRGDGQPPMTEAGKAAFLQAITDGKGFVAVHAASDSFHSPGNLDHGPARNQNDGANTTDYVKMLGAEFIKHDAQQPAHQIIADEKFPGMNAVPPDFGPHEEWYSLKNFAPDLHVLLVQDTKGMTGPSYARPNYPATWARRHGQGRVFYTSMGHREDVWLNPVFQSVLLGGLNWSLRRVEADVTPNLARVAPQAHVLPAYVAPPPPVPKAAKKK